MKTVLRAGPLVLSVLPAACETERPTPAQIAPPHASAQSIPDAVLSGTLRGRPFEARDMRYHVVRKPGGEQVDLKLSAAQAAAPCGRRRPPDAPSVWIRFPRQGAIAVGEQRCRPQDQCPYEVHYQVKEDGRWRGSGDGASLLVIRHVQPGVRIEGDLAVCFADEQASCVAGSFSATHCPDPVAPPLRNLGPPAGADAEASLERDASDAR